MAHDARAVANCFINNGIYAESPITPMQVLKLSYLAHGWSLAVLDRSLIDEEIEAWKFGPVIPSVYHALKHCGPNPVTSLILTAFTDRPIQADLTDDEKIVIDKVWRAYGKFAGHELSAMTHRKGTPWRNVFDQSEGNLQKGVKIPNSEIKKHFSLIGGLANA